MNVCFIGARRHSRAPWPRVSTLAVCLVAAGLAPIAAAGDPGAEAKLPPIHPASGQYDCGYRSPEDAIRAVQEAVARGEIANPSIPLLPSMGGVAAATDGTCVPVVTADDIFPYEDSSGLLLTNFSDGQLFNLMTQAANALIFAEGDDFDFIAFWVNFTPDHTLGVAFYLGLFNDTTGLGINPFNFRGDIGLASAAVQGYVMMWNINSSFWQPGTGSNANFTRLALGQEFEHRFGMFLPSISGGRTLQGDNGDCGRSSHWNFKVDGQGSGMEIAEWVGDSTLTRSGGSLNFNTDIGGVFSYTDLYLMGYVSPAEMDAGNSELRYLNNNFTCSSPYSGVVTDFSSTNIVAAAGVRVPSSDSAQKHFRSAWIMIHQPGSPPTASQLDKAAGILNTWSDTYHEGTIGRGTMNNSLRAGCTPFLELRPQSASTTHEIFGRTIVIDPGGSQVVFDVFVSGWTPDELSEYNIVLDSTGYTSGTSGTLSPAGGCCPGTASGASIDEGRSDYLFAGAPSATASTDLSSLDFVWSAALGDLNESVPDPSERRYLGTLVVDVPADASGEFTIGLDESTTSVADQTGAPISGLLFSPGTIAILPNNLTCDAAIEINCNSSVEFDNTFVTGAPSPNYSCRILNNHDGTLWFKFVATSDAARVSTCNSIAQDSTLAVYDGTCPVSVLGEVGCSEDVCGPSGFLSDACAEGLTPGETYLIQISAWDSGSRGKYTLELDCPCEGITDCNNNGVDDFQDIQEGTSLDCNESLIPDECELVDNDRNANQVPDECEPAPALEPASGEGDKNRFISFVVPPSGEETAILVRLTSLHHPGQPPDAPDFTVFEGEDRWVVPISQDPKTGDPILECADSPSFATTYACARLSCTPAFLDWAALLGSQPLHVTGEAIVPSSLYDVAQIPAFCSGDPDTCNAVSPSLPVTTATWGDAEPGNLDIVDVTTVVDRVKDLSGAKPERHTLLHPNDTSPDTRTPDVIDVTLTVDALKLFPYPLEGPVPCP